MANGQHCCANRGQGQPDGARPAGRQLLDHHHQETPAPASVRRTLRSRGWRTNRELPTPGSWRPESTASMTSTGRPRALLWGGLGGLLQLATPTSGDYRDSGLYAAGPFSPAGRAHPVIVALRGLAAPPATTTCVSRLSGGAAATTLGPDARILRCLTLSEDHP